MGTSTSKETKRRWVEVAAAGVLNGNGATTMLVPAQTDGGNKQNVFKIQQWCGDARYVLAYMVKQQNCYPGSGCETSWPASKVDEMNCFRVLGWWKENQMKGGKSNYYNVEINDVWVVHTSPGQDSVSFESASVQGLFITTYDQVDKYARLGVEPRTLSTLTDANRFRVK
jgi:hypothetical protein